MTFEEAMLSAWKTLMEHKDDGQCMGCFAYVKPEDTHCHNCNRPLICLVKVDEQANVPNQP